MDFVRGIDYVARVIVSTAQVVSRPGSIVKCRPESG